MTSIEWVKNADGTQCESAGAAMSKFLTRFLFETSPWNPFWAAWSVGYCIIGSDGLVYLTEAGAEYLGGRSA